MRNVVFDSRSFRWKEENGTMVIWDRYDGTVSDRFNLSIFNYDVVPKVSGNEIFQILKLEAISPVTEMNEL